MVSENLVNFSFSQADIRLKNLKKGLMLNTFHKFKIDLKTAALFVTSQKSFSISRIKQSKTIFFVINPCLTQ